MTPRQVELAKHICAPLQQKAMMMREKYAVEEVAKARDKTTGEIDQIEAEGWLKLGSHAIRPPDELDRLHTGVGRIVVRASKATLAMMRDPNIHPDATT